MQQDSDNTFNEFLAQVKAHFDQQNATLAEYEKFFNRAQELFPSYAAFVQNVNDALTVINQSKTTTEPVKEKIAAKIESITPQVNLKLVEQKKILIVDDAEINRVLMGHFFKKMPVILEFASSGDQALQKIAHHNFDLVLMDLQMKGMSGVETIKSIREAQPENLKKTIIVAITNLAPTDEERAQAIEVGANEYLSKSMSREAIKEKVFEFIFGNRQISA